MLIALEATDHFPHPEGHYPVLGTLLSLCFYLFLSYLCVGSSSSPWTLKAGISWDSVSQIPLFSLLSLSGKFSHLPGFNCHPCPQKPQIYVPGSDSYSQLWTFVSIRTSQRHLEINKPRTELRLFPQIWTCASECSHHPARKQGSILYASMFLIPPTRQSYELWIWCPNHTHIWHTHVCLGLPISNAATILVHSTNTFNPLTTVPSLDFTMYPLSFSTQPQASKSRHSN